ncbi:mCG1050959 [Mus musculus]|nr:mCG1050959 [Mus musculus]
MMVMGTQRCSQLRAYACLHCLLIPWAALLATPPPSFKGRSSLLRKLGSLFL